jgi:hypothetical protein
MNYIIITFLLISFPIHSQNTWIRINQLGYTVKSVKVAVLLSKTSITLDRFEIYDAITEQLVFQGNEITSMGNYGNFKSSFRLNFSEFNSNGSYYLQATGVKSPVFRISNDVYKGTADFILKYMRQQRCGYNPFLKDSCHTKDGFIVDHPTLTGKYINVTGGWHDASDYLQYVTTSANAIYQMLFAYLKNPEVFGDKYNADGDEAPNGIPDILDEAKWGLDWLVKMNPDSGFMFNQIADDRDHLGFRLPNHDSVDYGKGFERPVYFVTGKQQGICKYKNRTTGVSSTAGKFSSAFALGYDLLKDYYPEFCEGLLKKAIDAYEFAKTDLGVCQTASCHSPYFYEEDNYTDDLELAAIQLYKSSKDSIFFKESIEWGKVEPFTPWMGADTARHYQWYPFVNLGHYHLSELSDSNISKKFIDFYRTGIENIYRRSDDNPFKVGIPFIWCSNNLVSAILTQLRLYNEFTQEEKFLEMEASLRDWLFGCNPWGTSMIIGLPESGDYPQDPHSAFSALYGYRIDGGLVDGPVYSSIYTNLVGIKLNNGDEYIEFQPGYIVYHDDYGDYSTNEPTMDGTASLSFYLSSIEALGKD